MCRSEREGEEDRKEEREEEAKKKRGNEKREARKKKGDVNEVEKGDHIHTTSMKGTGKARDKLTSMPSCVIPSSSPRGRGLVLSAAVQYVRLKLPPLCAGGTLEWALLPSHLRRAGHCRGEAWFQPHFVDWNGGTDSPCFRMRLCEMEHIVEGVTIECLSEIAAFT